MTNRRVNGMTFDEYIRDAQETLGFSEEVARTMAILAWGGSGDVIEVDENGKAINPVDDELGGTTE